jgi:hypothetical protein
MRSRIRRSNKAISFTQRLVNLISEPDFIQFENILGEPNIFKIVGRTHYERWHSCFLGWLIDPNGSHLLSNYSLIRFLLLLLDERCLKADNHSEKTLLSVLPTIRFSNVDITPNEYLSTERSVEGVGRFDIFLTARFDNGLGQEGKLNIVIELKIDSRPNPGQSKRYADWLYESYPNDINLLVYLTPNLLETSKLTVGDDRWYCLDYQLLHDKLLLLVLAHPNLNEKVRPFILQYVKNLKIRYKGIKMAITDEERRMAIALYEKYSDVFDSIYDALLATGAINYKISDTISKGRASGRIAVRLDGRVFSNETTRQLFEDILKYIVDKQHVLRIPLPWGSSKQRYIITHANPPVHPNGRDFFYPVKYNGYTMESHYDRERGIKVLENLCKELELEFEIIEA